MKGAGTNLHTFGRGVAFDFPCGVDEDYGGDDDGARKKNYIQ